MHKNSDNLYVNCSFAPCTLQEGLDIWQTDWPLCQGWKCIESLHENSRNPKLAKVSNLLPSCKVQGLGKTLISPAMDVILPGLLLPSWGPRMFFIIINENKKKSYLLQSFSGLYVSQIGSTSSVIVLFSSMWLKRNIFIICTINRLRWPVSHFQFWLYSCITWLLIYSYWHSILFLVSSLLTPNSQGWWSNFSPDNAIQFSVLTMKLGGAESNGTSVLVSIALPKMLKVPFILIVLKAFEVNMGWITRHHSVKPLKWSSYRWHFGWGKGCRPFAMCKIVALQR